MRRGDLLLSVKIHNDHIIHTDGFVADSCRLVLPFLHSLAGGLLESNSRLGALDYLRGAYFPIHLNGRLQEDPSLSANRERFIRETRQDPLLQLRGDQTTSLSLELTGFTRSLLQAPYVDGCLLSPCRKRKNRTKDGGDQGHDKDSHGMAIQG